MSRQALESAAEMLAVEMAAAGYADPDSVEQWRAPIESARSILKALERRGYRLTHLPTSDWQEVMEACLDWIGSECRPDAEWVAHGHNWSMSDDDRERGAAILQRGRSVLNESRLAGPR